MTTHTRLDQAQAGVMNIRRTATVLGTVAFGAATLLGSGIAQAAPATTSPAEGWKITVINETPQTLRGQEGIFSNIKTLPRNIASHQSDVVVGDEWTTGPENIDFRYAIGASAYQNGVNFTVRPNTDGSTGRLNCMPDISIDGGLHCESKDVDAKTKTAEVHIW